MGKKVEILLHSRRYKYDIDENVLFKRFNISQSLLSTAFINFLRNFLQKETYFIFIIKRKKSI